MKGNKNSGMVGFRNSTRRMKREWRRLGHREKILRRILTKIFSALKLGAHDHLVVSLGNDLQRSAGLDSQGRDLSPKQNSPPGRCCYEPKSWWKKPSPRDWSPGSSCTCRAETASAAEMKKGHCASPIELFIFVINRRVLKQRQFNYYSWCLYE